MRAQVTPPHSDFVLWDDVIALNYTGERFREDDIIEFVGTSRGLMTYKAILGNEVTIPNIDVMQARFLRIHFLFVSRKKLCNGPFWEAIIRWAIERGQIGILWAQVV